MANAMESRVSNILGVIRAIYNEPGISRPRLCSQCQLAPSTVQGIVSRLEELEVVERLGAADSTGGRKAMRYQISANHKGIGAVSITPASVRTAVLSLGLEVLGQKQRQVTLARTGPQSYVAEVAADLRTLLEASPFAKGQIVGVGVGLPGPTDFATGTIHRMHGAPAWEEFPFGRRMSEQLGFPVWVDKDIYLAASHLVRQGDISSVGGSVYLSVREGISAALVVNGTVFRGAHGFAGEVGHTTVRRDGIRCACGNSGCLELYCSDSGLVNQYNILSDQPCGGIDQLIQRAGEGDEAANRIFSQAVRYLVEAAANIVMSCDPAEIVIDCRWLSRLENCYLALLDGLYAKNNFTRKYTVNVRLLQERDLALPAAAARVGEQYLFSPQSELMEKMEL